MRNEVACWILKINATRRRKDFDRPKGECALNAQIWRCGLRAFLIAIKVAYLPVHSKYQTGNFVSHYISINIMERGIIILIISIWIAGCNPIEKRNLQLNHDSFSNYYQLGDYSVGFCDTVIFEDDLRFEFLPDTTVSYKQYDYEGPSPLFIQIWHPISKKPKESPLTFGQLRKRKLTDQLESVYKPLFIKSDSFFVEFNINWYIKNLDSLKWGKLTYDSLDGFEVLNILKGYQTQSYYQKFNTPKNFPLIVYHHGAQSSSDENFVLAEYFASRGYVFVSSNFHLPFEKRMYGYEGVIFDDTKLPKTLLDFSKKLIEHHNKVIFIGHSAGAQVGFKFLYNEDIDAFVSLETTMEGEEKEDLFSEDGWPDVANENHFIMMLNQFF
jgi:hypothetical protein